jgi:hypothetical protein
MRKSVIEATERIVGGPLPDAAHQMAVELADVRFVLAGEREDHRLTLERMSERHEEERAAALETAKQHVEELTAAWEKERGELLESLADLVTRCDGPEGVRADGSNLQTMAAHAVLDEIEADGSRAEDVNPT